MQCTSLRGRPIIVERGVQVYSGPGQIPQPHHGERRVWSYLLHKWWFVLLFALLGGIAGLLLDRERTLPYEATTVVQAVQTSLETEDFGLAETLFATDAVISPVIEQLRLDTTPDALLAGTYLTAEAQPGGALKVTGRSTVSDEALQLANLSAESFETALEGRGLGTFTVLEAGQAVSRTGASTRVAVISGTVVGGMGAAALLLLWFFLRQPVLSMDQAAGQIQPAMSFFVQVRFGQGGALRGQNRGRRARGSRPEVFPRGIAQAVWHAVRRDRGVSGAAPLCCVVVESTRQSSLPLAVLLTRLGIEAHWQGGAAINSDSNYWVRAGDEGAEKAMGLAQTVVVLVPEGCPSDRLQSLADELLATPGERRRILVFVKSSRGRRASIIGTDRDRRSPEELFPQSPGPEEARSTTP